MSSGQFNMKKGNNYGDEETRTISPMRVKGGASHAECLELNCITED